LILHKYCESKACFDIFIQTLEYLNYFFKNLTKKDV